VRLGEKRKKKFREKRREKHSLQVKSNWNRKRGKKEKQYQDTSQTSAATLGY